MSEAGDIGVFNPSKEIAKEVTLQVLIRHRDAIYQAREGFFGLDLDKTITDSEKKINKVKGLYKVISAQREMINISRPIVRHRCFVMWNRKNPSPEDKEKNLFEDEDNDYNKINMVKEVLKQAEMDIIKAERTASQKDDYLIKKDTPEGTQYLLTDKYFDMINGLEDTFEKIYLIMLKHKIVSAGIDEDEEKTYKELEKESIEKVKEA